MKVGVRKPSVSKRVKARTTGRVKRSVKKAVIPYYGVKGTGIIKNPKKAVYNKVYKRTTVGVDDIVAVGVAASKKNNNAQHRSDTDYVNANTKIPPKGKLKASGIVLRIIGILFFLIAAVGFLAEVYSLGVVGLVAGLLIWRSSNRFRFIVSEDQGIEDDNGIESISYSIVDDDRKQQDISIDVKTSSEE